MFYLFLFMFLLSSKLPPISGCTKGSSQLSSFPSLCQRSPWHRGILTPRATAGPYFYESKNWDRTGWDSIFLTAGSTWSRDCWHTSCTAAGADTGSEFPNHTGAGGSCVQIHPIILRFKAMVPLFEFTFSPIYKSLFSFPHKICMADPAMAGILQVKPG